ncbi:unnamed protein product, partial [Aphanomyces euteiches]
MKSLTCVVVGDGNLFTVDIEDDKSVADLKQLIQTKVLLLMVYDMDRLALFAANKGNLWRESGEDWLRLDEPAVQLLKQKTQSEISDLLKESRKMHPTERLGDIFKCAPVEDVLHVLVQVVHPERLQLPLCTDDAQVKNLKFSAEHNYHDEISVGQCYKMAMLEIEGRSSLAFHEKTIYCRQDMKNMLEALDKMERGIRINGPPGMGKSITTWLWVCNQVKKGRSVLWIHLLDCVSERIIQLTPSGASLIVPNDKLSFVEDTEDDIIVLDGFTEDHVSLGWRAFETRTNAHRQTITISNVSIKTKDEEEEYLKRTCFDMTPWKLDEYFAAVENEAFFTSVQPYLGMYADMKTAIDHKFYFAGLSVRWMFGMNRSQVIQDIAKCFDHCPNSA